MAAENPYKGLRDGAFGDHRYPRTGPRPGPWRRPSFEAPPGPTSLGWGLLEGVGAKLPVLGRALGILHGKGAVAGVDLAEARSMVEPLVPNGNGRDDYRART